MKKTLSCILSFLPTAIILVSMIILIIITGLENSGYSISMGMEIFRICTLLFEFAGVIFGFVLTVIYIIKTVKSKKLSTGMKVLWCVLLFYLSVFLYALLPVYW